MRKEALILAPRILITLSEIVPPPFFFFKFTEVFGACLELG